MFMYDKYIFLKSSMESLWGRDAWYALKETHSVKIWRKYVVKTLQAIKISIHTSIEIYDKEWIAQINKQIDDGIENAISVKEIDELIAVLCSTFIEVSFLQVGSMPQRKTCRKKVTLQKSNWKLDEFRKVVYLQTPSQKEKLFLRNLRKKLGFSETQKLFFDYNQSKSELPFSEWVEGQPRSPKSGTATATPS